VVKREDLMCRRRLYPSSDWRRHDRRLVLLGQSRMNMMCVYSGNVSCTPVSLLRVLLRCSRRA
jgi:hypothetical protein